MAANLKYTLANNVRAVLSAGITNSATSITITNASAPYRNPPTPSADQDGVSVATLYDSITAPTKVEIVTYTTITDNGNGTSTLTGVLRGVEGSSAQAFSSGAVMIQSLTAGAMDGSKQASNIALLCGDGSDGDLTASSGTTTLTRDAYYHNVTLTSTAAIDCAGWDLYVSGVLDISAAGAGAIHGANGANGASQVGGAGGISYHGGAGTSGGNGGAGNAGGGLDGQTGTIPTFSIGGQGSDGNFGGSGGGGPGGGGLGAVSTTVAVRRPLMGLTMGTTAIAGGCGGGGGGGRGVSGAYGGGGGGGGGSLRIRAQTIKRSGSTTAGAIAAGKGGTPGSPNNGGGTGGSGGGGGVIIEYGSLTGSSATNCVESAGGNSAAFGGALHLINISTGAVTYVAPTVNKAQASL